LSQEADVRPVVLIVEDEPIQRMNTADMLEEAGFRAVEAANAKQAILILESHPDIRVVLSDVDMPPGMDGMELVALVRDRWPPIALILVSGQLTVSNVRLPQDALFFSKPFRPTELIAAVSRLAA
jgi:CheY-like chemotaxis protein